MPGGSFAICATRCSNIDCGAGISGIHTGEVQAFIKITHILKARYEYMLRHAKEMAGRFTTRRNPAPCLPQRDCVTASKRLI